MVFSSATRNTKKEKKSDPVTGPVWPRGWVELQLYSSMTAALEGGEWSAARPGRTLSHGKDRLPILQEAGWSPGPVWTGGKSRYHRDSIPDRPARSQSLYQLSYPAHMRNTKVQKNYWLVRRVAKSPIRLTWRRKVQGSILSRGTWILRFRISKLFLISWIFLRDRLR